MSAIAAAPLVGFPHCLWADTISSPIPPHWGLAVPGVHAYALEHSTAAGDMLELCVSSSVPYRLSICRLGPQVDDPVGDTVLARFDESPANPQPIHPGSYVHFGKRLTEPLKAFTLECWVRPSATNAFAGLITQYDYKTACGLGLTLGPGGVEDYLQKSGNLLVLSGNTMCWRVSFNDDCTVMECRKVDGGGSQVPDKRRGEAWHSHDGLRGGRQRECGMPGYRLIALDIIGWNNPSNPNNWGPYVVEDENHFLLTTPERTGLKNGDKYGWAGEGRAPMANVHEMDIRPSTYAALQEEPTPEGAVMPADPPGIVRIANGIVPWTKGGAAKDYYGRVIKPKTDQGGEMIYWERTDGGRVFNAGAIGSAWVLHCDPRWAAVVRNVLHHFGVARNKP